MQTVFAFRAAAGNGRIASGVIDAETSEKARAILATRGLYVLALDAKGPRRSRRERLSARTPRSLRVEGEHVQPARREDRPRFLARLGVDDAGRDAPVPGRGPEREYGLHAASLLTDWPV